MDLNIYNASVYKDFEERKKKQFISNDVDKVRKAHESGKLTAQERLQELFDNRVYEETMPFRKNSCVNFEFYKKELGNEGVISGFGRVNQRKTIAFSNDVFVMGASVGEAQGDKICKSIDLAMKSGIPIVGLNEASGARIQEGVAGLNAYCTIFGKTSVASGWIPQISVILGTCAGGTAYASALTDFIIMTESASTLFITGPAVIKSVTGEEVTFENLGGSKIHTSKTGLAHFVAKDEKEAIALAKNLLSFLPQNSKELPPEYINEDPIKRKTPEIKRTIPINPNKGFDVRDVVKPILDNNYFFEVQERFAVNMVIGFGRINGKTVGIVGNQPKVLAGCIDINASWKAARFVRFCDSFNIPIITFADCPGYLPGVEQEHNGIIRNGSKLLFAFAEATVPKVTIVMRKNYGGAYSAMCGKGLGADVVLAYPTAELAVMGAEGAVNIIHKKDIENASDPEKRKRELIEEYKNEYLTPYKGAEYGIVDDVIDPASTREKISGYLDILVDKEQWMPYKKHSNIPL